MKKIPKKPTHGDLVFRRTFDAPLQLVWDAWTKPKWIKCWWGPDGFSCPLAKINLSVGGVSLVGMRAPKEFGGQDFYSTWTYVKIVELQLIEYVHNLADKKGHTIDPVTVGMPADFPQGMRHVVALKALGKDQTALTVTEYDWPAGPMRKMSKQGMEQCLEKMAEALAK